jgi:hypothetical protein
MKSIFFVLSLLCVTLRGNAQYYDDVLTYTATSTPVNGVKIKTNLPFTNNTQMPTIFIEGYAYNTGEPINLILDYYINADVFQKSKVSTSGSHNPPITLAAENGKVVIFIDSKIYYQRFHVRAFAYGKSADITSNYTGWTAVDSTLSATATAAFLVPYQNRFSGDVYLPGASLWDSNGHVGIGTTSPGDYQLAVEGTIGARKVEIKQSSWADFVFKPNYQLPSLQALENYINVNQHLPGIPSEAEVQKNGIDLGEMNKKLLQKIEELTLYMIDMKKEMEQLKASKK